MSNTIRTGTAKVGQHRDNPRIYIQGQYLIQAGFNSGEHFEVEADPDNKTLRIRLNPEAKRKVSGKGGKKEGTTAVPVIDINSPIIQEALGRTKNIQIETRQGEIIITPAKIKAKTAARTLAAVSMAIFAGGGLLCQAATEAGFPPRAAVEVNQKYADIYQQNHPQAHVYNMSVEDVTYEDMASHRPVGLLTAGVCCEPFSAIRRLDRGGQTKRDKSLPPEAHELGDMTFWALRAIDATNPHTVIIECVPKYLESGAGFIMKHVLVRMGYTVDARVINPLEYGSIAGRKRAVVVGTMFDRVTWPDISPAGTRLSSLLDDIDPDDERWLGPDHWAAKHWEKQTAKGNGFEPPKLTGDATRVPTIKKGYMKRQGDNPVVQHPYKLDHFRWFTLSELRRIMGLRDSYCLGEAKTTAGEIIGQGVEVSTFVRVIRSVTKMNNQALERCG